MTLLNNKEKATLINADCLRVMERLEDNSIELVYLDPPWNIDDKNSNLSRDEYEDFLFAVIQQSKRLLKENGNLLLYSNPALNFNFHKLLEPVFGQDNSYIEFILPRRRGVHSTQFSYAHETVIRYPVSDKSKFYPLVEKSPEEIKNRFRLIENGKRYALYDLTTYSNRLGLNYDWQGFTLPPNRTWRFSKQKMDLLEAAGKIYFQKDMRLPRLKVFADDNNLQNVSSIWDDINTYSRSKDFCTEQSTELFERIFKLFSDENDTILDAFAGSGASGLSALKQNRKWIGIEKSRELFPRVEARFKNDEINIRTESQILEEKIVWNQYAAFNATEAEVVAEIIKKGETQRVELKSSYCFSHYTEKKDKTLPNKIMKEVAAFLNSKYGGSIFLGVEDDGTLNGLAKDMESSDSSKKNQDGLELAITSKLKDTFGGAIIDNFSTHFFEIDGFTVGEIRVSPSKEPIFLKKDYYIRSGTQAMKLEAQEMYQLIIERNE